MAVFHPGHEPLHGVTVVVDGASGRTYVGRYHERTPKGIVMLDVAIHDPNSASDARDTWLAKQVKFGISIAYKHFVVPAEEAGRVSPLGAYQI